MTKYKKSEKLKNIYAYAILMDKLYYLKNDIIHLNGNELLPLNDTCTFLNFEDKLLVINDDDARTLLIDNELSIDIKYKVEGVSSKHLRVFDYHKSDYSSIYNLLDFTNNKLIFQKFNNAKPFSINENIIIVEKNSSFYLYNKDKLLWQVDLSNISYSTQITKLLGTANNNLFILVKDSNLIVLNLLDGSLIRVLNSKETLLSQDAFLHPECNHIYSLADYFIKINTGTLSVETKKKIVEDKNHNNSSPILYGIKSSALQGEYISFTSFTKVRFGFAKWIGLYDYTKEELAWHHELLPSEGQLSIPAFEYPKLAGEKLYILDTEDTLHILERETEV